MRKTAKITRAMVGRARVGTQPTEPTKKTVKTPLRKRKKGK